MSLFLAIHVFKFNSNVLEASIYFYLGLRVGVVCKQAVFHVLVVL
jgi:hypothetical protein